MGKARGGDCRQTRRDEGIINGMHAGNLSKKMRGNRKIWVGDIKTQEV